MIRFTKPSQTRALKLAVATVSATAGFAAAVLVGVAFAATFTVKVAQNAKVTNQSGITTTENIAVNRRGFALYTLSGDSKSHPECKKGNGCFSFWPPLTVSLANKLSKAPGIHGTLRRWHRDGFYQVTLGGHPLYRYAGDSQRDTATGQGIQAFGGTWHVVTAAASTDGGMTTSSGTTSTMTTTTTPCPYPPYC